MYLAFRSHILILIYQTDFFPMNNFQYLNIYQPYMLYCIHNHTRYDSTHNHFYKNLHHLILYTHFDIHHSFIFALSYIQFHLIYIYTHTIHAEVNIFFNLHLTFLHRILYFIWIAYSSIWIINSVTTSITLISTNSN